MTADPTRGNVGTDRTEDLTTRTPDRGGTYEGGLTMMLGSLSPRLAVTAPHAPPSVTGMGTGTGSAPNDLEGGA